MMAGRWLWGATVLASLAWPFHPQPGHPGHERPKTPSVVEGARLYQRACLSCHGPRGDGQALVLLPDGTTAPRLDQLSEQGKSLPRLTQIISKGDGPMPGWGSVMSPVEIESLARYVASLNPSSPPSPSPKDGRSNP
ncbi:c-type cytochrome [Sulfobacillus harzensis]|uniref:Cytochrome c n=1 Tax=Sulfobacillus harzensis TaxID=2729629 RepID=A0A7Y0L2I2_9FIRM|nr:cytochrome c [Sulfobacillus harzensis]NMP22086.1 cytochrome c [Sulfobacillus harzensis]